MSLPENGQVGVQNSETERGGGIAAGRFYKVVIVQRPELGVPILEADELPLLRRPGLEVRLPQLIQKP